MSQAAKLTLAGTTLGALGIIAFVHYSQKAEQAAMHAGVIRDMEQQRIKKERQLDFAMQAELEAEYRKVQNVSASTQAVLPASQTRSGNGPVTASGPGVGSG